MDAASTPYLPITPQLAENGLLISIKKAALMEEACEATLKSNAKAQRLRAYQAYFGAPILVAIPDVREFLQSRGDITSRYHPKRENPSSFKLDLSAKLSKFQSTEYTADLQNNDHSPKNTSLDFILALFTEALPSEQALIVKLFSEITNKLSSLVAPLGPD